MFIFIIARTPLKMRTPLREGLWKISCESLIAQTSSNWKAIVVGDTKNDQLNTDFFITLDFDEYVKTEKIKIALDFLKNNQSLKPEYLIRFDDDDIFSSTIIRDIENLPKKFDCYFDEYHVFVDSVYLKISNKKNNWIANTAIHKYEHAISICGTVAEPLLLQDHSEYWEQYYKNKATFVAQKNSPIYYRVLTPFSISSVNNLKKDVSLWTSHLMYLRGYGPWINLPKQFPFYSNLKVISQIYFQNKPILSFVHWTINYTKYQIRNILY